MTASTQPFLFSYTILILDSKNAKINFYPIIILCQSHETNTMCTLKFRNIGHVAVEEMIVVTAGANTFQKTWLFENCNLSPKFGGFATARAKKSLPVVE